MTKLMNAFRCIYLGLLSTVAFSLFPARGQPQAKSPEEFRFNGGSFRDFTEKLGQQFGTNFLDVLEVRGEEANWLQIPKMRHTGHRADGNRTLKLYNLVSEEGDGFLGKWIFTPERPTWITDGTGPSQPTPPETLIFMPPKPSAG